MGETERLYGVLDHQLSSNKYLVGDKYSLADIATFGWVNGAGMIGIDLEKQFPNLHRWWKLVKERPGVKRGMAVPKQSKFTSEAELEMKRDDPEYKKKTEEFKKLADEAKEKYGYVYKSP